MYSFVEAPVKVALDESHVRSVFSRLFFSFAAVLALRPSCKLKTKKRIGKKKHLEEKNIR